MEEAIYLAKLATKVTVIHRRDTLRASKVMQDKAMSMPNISFIWNTEVVDIKDIDQGKVTSLVLRDTQTRRDQRARRRRRVHRHRPRAEHRALQGPAGDARQRLPEDARRIAHERARACSPRATSRITSIARR